jgi:hypothetical protein
MTETTPTAEEKHQAQLAYCRAKGFPHFAPTNRCWNCGRNIYDRITLDRAKSDLITGCPYCCRSYCD